MTRGIGPIHHFQGIESRGEQDDWSGKYSTLFYSLLPSNLSLLLNSPFPSPISTQWAAQRHHQQVDCNRIRVTNDGLKKEEMRRTSFTAGKEEQMRLRSNEGLETFLAFESPNCVTIKRYQPFAAHPCRLPAPISRDRQCLSPKNDSSSAQGVTISAPFESRFCRSPGPMRRRGSSEC